MVLTSCQDFLNTSTPSQLDNATVFNSVTYTQTEIMGVYSYLASGTVYGARVPLNWASNSDIEYAGADANSYIENTNRGLSNYYATTGNTVLNWTNIYTMIERANLCIDGIRNSSLLTTSDSTKMKIYLGEALTLRAMGYFDLVRNFGDVPFKDESTKPDLSNVFLGKTDRDTIYNHIIRDLLTAEKYVPWLNQSTYTCERITKGFIKGLTARICLSAGGYSLRDKPDLGYPMERPTNWMDYYKLANKECKEIIENGTHNLNPSYVGIWKTVNSLKLETSYNENLFEVAFGLGQNGEMGYSIGVRFYTNTKYGYGNNANVVNTSAYYLYSFDRSDLRKDVTIAQETYSNSLGDLKEVYTTKPYSYNIGKWDQRWMSDAWKAQNIAAKGKIGYGINWIVMRYADVLLMFAETENEINGGPTDAAKNALKQVRARSFAATDYTTKVENYVNALSNHDTFFDAITNERAWEFGGEAIRKYDLIRWNLFEKKIQDQRDGFAALLNGGSVTIFGNTYSTIPTKLYYKYVANKENIDWANINYYAPVDSLDALATTTLTAHGWTKVTWLSGNTQATKDTYNNLLKLFSSGSQKAYNGVCDNRYLLPIQSQAITDSNGKLTNSYGF